MDFWLGVYAGSCFTLVTIPIVVIVLDWCFGLFKCTGSGK